MTDFTGGDDDMFIERMLEKGYFPENLPPVFEVQNLHELSLRTMPAKEYITGQPTENSKYNSSKRGAQRRIFSIPNPVFMLDTTMFFLNHKDEINEHLNISTDSCSKPTFNASNGRPLTINSYPEFHKKRREKLAASKFVIKTDISRFYYSLYTHAIPWALHGKPRSKRDRKIDSSEIFGNKLDHIIRQSQDGQTVGIPVGPDCSRLIAEIIGVSIDNAFRRLHHNTPMLRLVDDIFIGADNRDDAATYLSAIRDAIRLFELDINDSKTLILNSSEDLEPYWPVEIRREVRRFSEDDGTKRSQKRADFVHFLDNVIRESNSKNDEGIVKFALRKIDESHIWARYWDLLEPFLVRTAISFPHCWDYLARVVAWRNRTEEVNKALWQDVIQKAVAQNARSGNDFEVSWALWLAKELNTSISSQTFDKIATKCGPLSILMSLDVHASCKLDFKIPKETLLDRIGDKPMLGSNWILAYEADLQFGFKIKTKNLQGNDLFKMLYDDTVSFYNRQAIPAVFENIKDSKAVKSAIESSGSAYEEIYDGDEEDEDAVDDLDF